MLYHKQEHIYVEGDDAQRGSCYATVIACLLDLDLHRVPYVHLFYWSKTEKENLSIHANKNYLEDKHIDNVEEYKKDNYHQFVSMQMNLWHMVMDTWLIARGYREDWISISRLEDYLRDNPGKPYMASGISSRGVQHVVIYQDGKLLHDPHPSNDGLVKLDYYRWLIPITQDQGKYWEAEIKD